MYAAGGANENVVASVMPVWVCLAFPGLRTRQRDAHHLLMAVSVMSVFVGTHTHTHTHHVSLLSVLRVRDAHSGLGLRAHACAGASRLTSPREAAATAVAAMMQLLRSVLPSITTRGDRARRECVRSCARPRTRTH